MEIVFARGSFLEPGPATVWMRPRVPLVEGEEFTPLQRVMVAADGGNGVSAPLDWSAYHLHQHRPERAPAAPARRASGSASTR